MKVKIKKFTRWIGPYQIASALSYIGVSEKHCRKFGDWLSGKQSDSIFSSRKSGIVATVCSKIHDYFDKRRIKIKIDPWDSWNAYHTLSLIAHPTLVMLKEQKQSFAIVDEEDVPEELRCGVVFEEDKTNEEYYSKKSAQWNWVLDEIIWAHAQVIDDSAEDQFNIGEMDFVEKKVVDESGEVFYALEDGPNHTWKFDKEGFKKFEERKRNGFRLFGKYYEHLWS